MADPAAADAAVVPIAVVEQQQQQQDGDVAAYPANVNFGFSNHEPVLPLRIIRHTQRTVDTEDRNESRNIFALFDENGDGFVTLDEFALIVRSLGLTPTEEDIDVLGERAFPEPNRISFEQFLNVKNTLVREKPSAKPHLEDAFRPFDKHGDGTMHVGDVRDVFTNLGEGVLPSQIGELINELRVDEEGRINIADFIDLLLE